MECRRQVINLRDPPKGIVFPTSECLVQWLPLYNVGKCFLDE